MAPRTRGARRPRATGFLGGPPALLFAEFRPSCQRNRLASTCPGPSLCRRRPGAVRRHANDRRHGGDGNAQVPGRHSQGSGGDTHRRQDERRRSQYPQPKRCHAFRFGRLRRNAQSAQPMYASPPTGESGGHSIVNRRTSRRWAGEKQCTHARGQGSFAGTIVRWLPCSGQVSSNSMTSTSTADLPARYRYIAYTDATLCPLYFC